MKRCIRVIVAALKIVYFGVASNNSKFLFCDLLPRVAYPTQDGTRDADSLGTMTPGEGESLGCR